MSDFKTVIIRGPDGLPPRFDLAVDGYQLAEDDGLETAILLCLFTDARALPDDVLPDPNDTDRRGWCGDSYADSPGIRFGSRLWLLERERELPAVAQRAQIYAQEAVDWLATTGVVERVVAEAAIIGTGVLGIAVSVYRPNRPARKYQFEHYWSAT